VAGYQVSYRPLPNVVDSMSGLANTAPASAASLENGRKYYAINCAVCHGDTGAATARRCATAWRASACWAALGRARTDGYSTG
jgi:mono/diheme cytochrome c family protein